jgi:hypothetical protein
MTIRLLGALACAFLVLVFGVSCGGPDAPAAATVQGRALLGGETDHSGIDVTLSGPTTARAVTDASGAYSFAGLPAGDYAVIASAKSTKEGLLTATAVASAGDTASVPDLTFQPLGDLAGKAARGGGEGNAGIVVVAAGTPAATVTDDAGQWVLHDVPTGARDVIASAPGYSSATTNVVVHYATSTPAPDLSLTKAAPAGGAISGKAILTGEAQSKGIAVTLTGWVSAGFVTGAAGAWSFGGLLDGAYVVTAAAPSTAEGSVSVSVTIAGAKSTTVPDLALTPLGSIRGVATLGSATTGNAGIVVFANGTAAAAFTDDAGNYRITRVPTGAHVVSATRPGFATGTAQAPAVTYAGTADAPAIALSPDPAVTGAVAGTATIVGRTQYDGTTARLAGTSYSATTALDGTFSIGNVPPLNYALSLANGAYGEQVPNLVVLARGQGLLVDGGQLYPMVPIELSRGPRLATAQINGFKVSPNGKTLAYVDRTTGTGVLRVLTLPAGPVISVSTGTIGLADNLCSPSPNCTESEYAYTADGAVLLYRTDPTWWGYKANTGTLKVVSVSGGPSTTFAGGVASFASTPDSARALWTVDNGSSSTPAIAYTLQSAPITGGAPVTIDSPLPQPTFVVAPTSASVAYITNGSTKAGLHTASTRGGAVATVGTGSPVAFQFSPDGQLIFFITNSTLEWAPLDGSAIASGPSGVGRFKLLANGTKVIVSGSAGMSILDVAGGNPTPLTTYSGNFIVTPDERNALYIENGWNLRVIPTTGGTSPTVIATGASSWIGFAAGGSPVFLAGAVTNPTTLVTTASLMTVPITGGTPTTLATGVPPLPSPMLSPDGHRIAYSGTACFPPLCPAVLWSVSTAGGTATALTSHATMAAWLDSTSLGAVRRGFSAPLSFQNGLYTVAAP